MKLLKLKIEDKEGFRSLQYGFEINFHNLNDIEAMKVFRPFCFAGLNGSGKSNVLEALANIFYHLNLCTAKFLPNSIQETENFQRNVSTPDAFTLEYLIGTIDASYDEISDLKKVVIYKKVGMEPIFNVYDFPYDQDNIIIPNKETLEKDIQEGSATEFGKLFQTNDKLWLPDNVVGYSSGENEILSLPFIKSRLIRLDEYKQASEAKAENYDINLEEKRARNSLVYIDSSMSQAVLLTCLLFEDDKTLAPLRDINNTGILGLKSFRMHINLHDFEFENDKGEKYTIPVLTLIDEYQLNDLIKCSTSWFIDRDEKLLYLDFYVNNATKKAFKKYFKTSFECFEFFKLLYELNSHFVSEAIKEDVYRSKGIYTDGKLPTASPSQNVFYFLDFYITKELKKTREKKDLLLRSFSDGEHQFLHTMGICLLLKNRRTLLLLDEPETHFNPSWRAKFVKVLNDSIEAGSKKMGANVHLLKDVLLTSHSPFIISDCSPDNVILFEKDEKGNVNCSTAKQKEFNTYGSSVDLILQIIFNMPYSISSQALEEIRLLLKSNDLQEILLGSTKFGESYEKGFLFERIEELKLLSKKK